MKIKGMKEKKIIVSSFSKMLAQVAIAMQKERENQGFKETSSLSLSKVSTSDCCDYGTPARRPVRKTRKDRAAQPLLEAKLVTPVSRRGFSPNMHSISISLPKIPTDDLLPSSPASTLSLPFTDVSTETSLNETLYPITPPLPPGLGYQIKSESTEQVRDNIRKPQSNLNAHFQQVKIEAPVLKKTKRSLEEAFPELLKNPFTSTRSFTSDFPKIECNENSTSDRSLDLEPEDLKGIERGRKLNYRVGNSPDKGIRMDFRAKEDDMDAAQMKRRLQELEESVYGPRIGTETPRGYQILIQRLDRMMPGIKLGNRLEKLGQIATAGNGSHYRMTQQAKDGPHQAAADLLAAEGLLNERIINVFRTSEVTRLDLGPSLSEEGGLNIGGRAVWNVFTRPHSFLFLSELSFNNTPVLDMDLVKLIGLPKLAVLGLKNTGVGDEGVFHLIALKLTLTRLDLSDNPCVTDDAVPALNLCINCKLNFLGLVGTSVAMPGLRLMAKLIQWEDRIVDVEIPEACESYIDDIPNIYLLYPQPPLITSPALCSRLSAAALQRNLEAHAEVANKRLATVGAKAAPVKIFTGGTKEEMCERLRNLLVKREVDLVVWGMIYGYEEADGGEWAGKDDTKKYIEAQAAAIEAHKGLR
ncbi:hypothetical protein C8J55DRAFT_522360 [Lentinula edodes]|uniref:RNI-like protein n=1 Tax=Lentinula lateritia TaxID=40482 RepID=A0A9W8ZZ34_9AGAR|nr:hypothetical protein C8J55DRAFT_522360 [Lentinula edodes]